MSARRKTTQRPPAPTDERLKRRLRATSVRCLPASGTPAAVQALTARRLRALRDATGLTREAFAGRMLAGDAGALAQRLWRYETRRAAPPMWLLVHVCRACGVSVEHLVEPDIELVELHDLVRRLPRSRRREALAMLRTWAAQARRRRHR